MKETVFDIAQIILAILLIVVILLQQKSAGLGGIFGGSGNIYSTKRGIDKILFYVTVVLTAVFSALALLRLIV